MASVKMFSENWSWKEWATMSAIVLAVLVIGYFLLLPGQLNKADMTAPTPAVSEYATPPAETAPAPTPQN